MRFRRTLRAPTSRPAIGGGPSANPPRGEAGIAVPTVLLAVVAAFGLGTAGLVAAVSAQRGTVRDQASKEALAAAESGVQEALLHYNRVPIASISTPCLTATSPPAPVPRSDPPDPESWCPAVGPRSLAGVAGANFTYWARPTAVQAGTIPDTLEIVSQGTVNGVSRTVEVVARSSAGLQPFAGSAGVIGLDFIDLESNGKIFGDVGTNGDITLDSNAEIHCDYAHVGVGHGVIENSQNVTYDCPEPEQGVLSLPPVNQGDVAPPTANNSNGRFFAQDLATRGLPDWDPETRELALDGNNTLTLGGSNYSFCRLSLDSNSAIFIAAGAEVRIYLDAPENCPGYDETEYQLELRSNSRITTTGGTPSKFALLFVGSADPNYPTSALLNSNTEANSACEQDFVIYGPRTDIEMDSNSHFCGAIAGKSITMNSNADITQSNLATDFVLPNTVAQHYTVENFVDCGAVAENPPDAGC